MYTLNYYKNLRSPLVLKTISIEKYIELVRTGIEKEQILSARLNKKGTHFYDAIKESRPCVTFNFLYNNYKRNSNIISSTGLLYYDIDIPNVEIDNSLVFLKHQSFGGHGSIVVIQAKGITEDNFKENYVSIAEHLGIPSEYDKSANKKTQYTVLSFDENVYYNPNSFVFTALEKKVSFAGKLGREENILLPNDTFSLNKEVSKMCRMTNASDYVTNGKEFQVFKEGIKVAKVDIPRRIPNGNRHNVILSIMNQLIALNPHLSYTKATAYAAGVNKHVCIDPLSEPEIRSIVNSIWRYKEEEKLQIINNKTRKVIFNQNCTLSKEEKVSVVNKAIGEIRTEQTELKIKSTIENWDILEKITQKAIAESIKMDIQTVKRYWSKFKELVAQKNTIIKSGLKKSSIEKLQIKSNVAEMINSSFINIEMENKEDSDMTISNTCLDSFNDFHFYVNSVASNKFNYDTIKRYFETMKESDIPRTQENIRSIFFLNKEEDNLA